MIKLPPANLLTVRSTLIFPLVLNLSGILNLICNLVNSIDHLLSIFYYI